MSAIPQATVRSRLENLIALAQLLERVENSPVETSADQYQALVHQLKSALGQELPPEALNTVLGAYPATAELYENLHYAQSGLSRSGLEQSVGAELRATQLIARVAKR